MKKQMFELKDSELGKDWILIREVQLEKLLEELLEEKLVNMNKQLIVYMPLMILCMLNIKELMMMLKEMMVFFVLQLLEIVEIVNKNRKALINSVLLIFSTRIQFSAPGSGFSVLLPKPAKSNSLHQALNSLCCKKLNQLIIRNL